MMWTAVALVSALSLGDQHPATYAGQERREVKALSAEEIQSYLEGHGTGLARTAELNHYPGLKHVLDLAAGLELTESQVALVRRIYERMHEEAVRLGRAIVERERELDRLFAGGGIGAGNLEKVVGEIAGLQGRLRAAHLRAHLETRALLSPEQVRSYDQLRGYGAHEHPPGRHR